MDLQLQMPFIYPFMCGFIFNEKVRPVETGCCCGQSTGRIG